MIVAIAIAAAAGVALVVGLVLSWTMTHRQRLTEIHTPADFGLAFEEVSFAAADGLMLRGWWIPAPGSKRAVIIVHGHGGSMDWDVHRAPALSAAGLGVLLFDLRGHGRSEGRMITFGYQERRDVLGAVDFLHGRGIRRIGVVGFSLGGRVAILGAADCPDIAAVIDDGGPARMRTAMAARGIEWHLPGWLTRPMAWLTLALTSVRLGANLFACEPVRRVATIAPRPILFIHGDQDQYCPDFDDLYAAARQPKELWRVPEAGHTTLSQLVPEEHERRVIAFFDRYL